MSELPKGWIELTLADVVKDITGGGTPSKSQKEYFKGTIPFMTVKDMKVNRPDDTIDKITQSAIDNSSANLIDANTLIISTRMGLGKIVKVDFACAINQDLKALYLEDVINIDYFEYQYRSLTSLLESLGKGTTVKGIRLEVLKSIKILVAPLNEQIRIANKLDSILAKVDKAQARLDKIPAILKRFRQSILAAATSGELTKEWRGVTSGLNEALADYADKIENGRFDSWVQSKLREFEKKGKLPQSDKWKEKYSCKRGNLEPEGRVEEWNYESLDYLADVIDPNPKHRNPKYFEEGYHFISTAQFDGYDDFDLSNCKFVALDTIEEQKERCNFSSRSIAVSRKGTIGETRILDLDFPFALLDSVCVVNIDRAISHRYLNYALRGEWVQKQIYSKTKGVALKQVSVGAVRELVIPIPVYSEQCEIVNKLDYMLSKATKVEKQYLEAKARLDRLTQSILVKAFRGELVPQDPNDESAEKLLERILAEKEQNQPKKATRKRATKAKTTEKE